MAFLDNSGATYLVSKIKTLINAKQDKTTAVTHTASTASGSSTNPVYINSSGIATACTYSLSKSVPSDAKFTDTTYSAATTSANGLMSSADKTKLNGIATGANNYVHPGSGTNPHGTTKSDVGLGNVGNFKAVSTVASQGLSATEQSNARANIGAGTSNFSGSYNDLTNKPTIASAKKFQNVSVATSAWVSNTDNEFIYKADITCNGVTSNDFPQVVFSDADVTYYDLAATCKSGSGVVTIYSNEIPSQAITVLSILCI